MPCGLPGSIVTVGFTTLTPVCGAPVQRSSITRLKRGIRSAKMSVRMDGDLCHPSMEGFAGSYLYRTTSSRSCRRSVTMRPATLSRGLPSRAPAVICIPGGASTVIVRGTALVPGCF